VAHLRARAMDIGVPPHGECEYCAGVAIRPELPAYAEQRGEQPAGLEV
jgi:hypothetical protein